MSTISTFSPFGPLSASNQTPFFRREGGAPQPPVRPQAQARPNFIDRAIEANTTDPRLSDPAYLARYQATVRYLEGISAPTRPDGARPLVTSEDQRTIDRLIAEHARTGDYENFVRSLLTAGVHPAQIAARAELWVRRDGSVVSRTGERVSQGVRVSA